MTTQIQAEINKFTKEQRKIIYENLFALELTEGCSIGCDFCGVCAPRLTGNAIPFSVLEQIADESITLTERTLVEKRNNAISYPLGALFLYDSSEPLDYEKDGKNYFEVFNLFIEKGFEIGTSTAIPKGKEELAIANLGRIHQISISHMNRERLAPYFHRLRISSFVDLKSFYEKKFGRDNQSKAPFRERFLEVRGDLESFIKSLKIMDPTLPTQARFYDLRVDGNGSRREVQDLKTLFLFCGESGEFSFDGTVMDRDYIQVKNSGKAFNFRSYEPENLLALDEPFANLCGVKITPTGIFNIFRTNSSQDNPTGRIVEQITPENFHVVKLERPSRPSSSIYGVIPPHAYAC